MESVEGWRYLPDLVHPKPHLNFALDICSEKNLLCPHARLYEYVLVCRLNQKYEVWTVKNKFSQR